MKKYTILTLAPVLALLAAGCTSPVAMQSTEYDDMYYSTTDKTEYIQPVGQVTEQGYQADNREYENSSEEVADGEVLNPEYSGNASGQQSYAEDEYYDGRTYDARDSWYRPNYSFVDPYWGSAYVPRYNSFNSYSYDPFYSSYNSYAYDPFYDSFGYDPYFNRPFYGSGLSISLGYNMGWGNPWGRNPYYSAWYPHNNFYNGYYGGMGNGYYSRNPYYAYYERPIIIGKAAKVQYGPRESRGAVVTDNVERANGRPARGNSISDRQEQRSAGSRSTYRTSRGNQAGGVIGSATESEAKEALPTRPSRNTYYDARDNQSRPSSRSAAPAERRQQQRQQTQPAQQQAPRTREYTPAPARERRSQPVQRQQPVQRETRTYESRPTRTYETQQSTPSRSYEPSRSSSPSPASSGSNSSGGRPSRGRGN